MGRFAHGLSPVPAMIEAMDKDTTGKWKKRTQYRGKFDLDLFMDALNAGSALKENPDPCSC